MDEKSKRAVELQCQASSLSNSSCLRNFISEVGAHMLSHFVQFKCHVSQASMICSKCHTYLTSHGPCMKVLAGTHAK